MKTIDVAVNIAPYTDMRVWLKGYGPRVAKAALAATGYAVDALAGANATNDEEAADDIVSSTLEWAKAHPDPKVPEDLRLVALKYGLLRLSLPATVTDDQVAEAAEINLMPDVLH